MLSFVVTHLHINIQDTRLFVGSEAQLDFHKIESFMVMRLFSPHNQPCLPPLPHFLNFYDHCKLYSMMIHESHSENVIKQLDSHLVKGIFR